MYRTIKDVDYKGKRVLVRVDYNVPLKEGHVKDNKRITASLSTIEYLLKEGASVVLMSHLGRPKGEYKEDLSMEPVAEELQKVLGKEVKFIPDKNVVSEEVISKVRELKPGEVALIENTRFVKGEEKNDEAFAKELAKLGEAYVNDAFGTSHRAHASNVGVSKYLPMALGFLVEKEVKNLDLVLKNPEKPYVAILGGAKVSDKINVIENLINIVDKIVIVGAMAFTFLKAEGVSVGKSLVEDDKIDFAKELLQKAKAKNVEIILPIDFVVADEVSEDAKAETVKEIPADKMGLDIGPETVALIKEKLTGVKTVVWNGPCGVFEIDKFAKGTFEVAHILAEIDAIKIVGGGDSASAIKKSGYEDKFTHISTGGGASLEYLEGKVLPGILPATLEDK